MEKNISVTQQDTKILKRKMQEKREKDRIYGKAITRFGESDHTVYGYSNSHRIDEIMAKIMKQSRGNITLMK